MFLLLFQVAFCHILVQLLLALAVCVVRTGLLVWIRSGCVLQVSAFMGIGCTRQCLNGLPVLLQAPARPGCPFVFNLPLPVHALLQSAEYALKVGRTF